MSRFIRQLRRFGKQRHRFDVVVTLDEVVIPDVLEEEFVLGWCQGKSKGRVAIDKENMLACIPFKSTMFYDLRTKTFEKKELQFWLQERKGNGKKHAQTSGFINTIDLATFPDTDAGRTGVSDPTEVTLAVDGNLAITVKMTVAWEWKRAHEVTEDVQTALSDVEEEEEEENADKDQTTDKSLDLATTPMHNRGSSHLSVSFAEADAMVSATTPGPVTPRILEGSPIPASSDEEVEELEEAYSRINVTHELINESAVELSKEEQIEQLVKALEMAEKRVVILERERAAQKARSTPSKAANRGYSAAVLGAAKVDSDDGLKTHVEYTLQVNVLGKNYFLGRRYRQFEFLHSGLSLAFSEKQLPAFPKKSAFRGSVTDLDSKVVKERQLAFSAYVEDLVHNPLLRERPEVLTFFEANSVLQTV